MNFDYKLDLQARELLSTFFNEKPRSWNLENVLKSFCKRVQSNNSIFIYGCGPSLEITAKYLVSTIEKKMTDNSIHLTADGATRFLRKICLPIDATFTDLDGIGIEDFYYPKYIVVHAHGDNMDKLIRYRTQIIQADNIIGTTQVKPNDQLINPGGFTDGDRILFFIKSLIKPDQKIYLIGMDFKDIVGKYSKPELKKNKKATPVKCKKLKYAFQLIEWFAEISENKIFLINSKVKIKNIKSISLSEISNLEF